MKKLTVLILSVLMVCLMAGCGNASGKLSDGNKVLFQVGKNKVTKNDFYKVMRDYDAGDFIIKQAAKQNFIPGKDFGIISYNETPLKEVLCGGITTLSTDFRQMGQTMASLLGKPGIEVIRNPWCLNLRSSL
jgi:hypothetical protein